MRKRLIIVAALTGALALGGCQVNLTKDRIEAKDHVEEAHGVVPNTTAQQASCTAGYGTWTPVSNDPKHAQCDVRERWLIIHGKKGGEPKVDEVQRSYWDQVKVGDVWKP